MSKVLLKRIGISALHGLFMIILMFAWLRQPYIFGYEFDITKDMILFETYLRGGEIKNKDKYYDKFYFINTAHSLVIDNSAASKRPNVRANREQLLKFLDIAEKHTNLYDIILFDVFINTLEDKIDTLLYNAVYRLKQQGKIVTSNYVHDNYITNHNEYYTQIEQNAFGDTLSGPIFYPMSMQDAHYKFFYHFLPDKGTPQKQLPLLAYECITKKQSSSSFLFNIFYTYKKQKGIFQNIYIPRIVLGHKDIVFTSNDGKRTPNTSNLDWIYHREETVVDILKNKPKPIIIIGDVMWGDTHYSTNGLIRGPLIAANALIALLEQNNRMHLSYLLFLWIIFTVVSYFTFYPYLIRQAKDARIKISWLASMRNYIMDELNYIILVFATLFGVFVFGHYIFLFFNVIYIFILEKTLPFVRKRFLKIYN